MKIVNFFIVGAPKAGTTSLYHYLNEYSEIEMSSIKEPNFFSDKALQDQKLYYQKKRIKTFEEYHALFEKDGTVLRGEASVSYLFYDDVPKSIFKYNSSAKIIIMLRNPIDRAFSHYMMDYKLGLIKDSFDKIIYNLSQDDKENLFFQQYIEVGKYAEQIKRYKEVFPKDNIYIVDYDDFKNETSTVVHNITKFLGVVQNPNYDFSKKHNIYRTPRNVIIRNIYSFAIIRQFLSRLLSDKYRHLFKNLLFHSDKKAKISEKTRDYLKQLFAHDIRLLSKLLNKDFTKWIK